MAVQDKHPLYLDFDDDWTMMRDAYRGERVVKQRGTTYLPPTSSMIQHGMSTVHSLGYQEYQAYKTRAVFHDFVSEAVEAMIGVMHSKPPTIELPAVMEEMRERATIHGESLEQLLRRINEQQLVAGRLGLLMDLPASPDQTNPMPYIAVYEAENIINWDDGERDDELPELNLVVLDESEYVRTRDFTWDYRNKYRVLILGAVDENEGGNSGAVYRTGVFGDNDATFREDDLTEPSVRGNVLERLPFVFVNSKDIVANPDDPPLIGLARLSMAIYRGEADYRQNLFLQSQDTLVVTGSTDEEGTQVGAGAVIHLPIGGDAKYVGVTSEGLSEQRSSLENDKAQAQSKTGQLDTSSRERESGEALGIRVAAQTATLNQLAKTGAMALQHILRIGAEWIGANPEEVVVTPNLDFVGDEMEPKSLVELMTAKSLGAPLSMRSIHRRMAAKDLTDMDYEEETAEIEQEEPLGGGGTDAGGDPDDEPPPDE